ncbi:MAG: HAD family hydrolase [Deltaproteobacteria bacterium]|nr:HAD family hydrolase [Deltaproteobacteria bacterium]
MGKARVNNVKATVLLDRDGTINIDYGYLSDPSNVVLIEGAAEALRRLNDRGIKAVVVSNQSGVNRGYFTDEDVSAVNRRLSELLGERGARMDGIYYCPHRPDEDCGCRKPKAGLFMKAAKEQGIDAGFIYVVGDKASDVELARNIEARSVLVLTGCGPEELKKLQSPPDFVASGISVAVDWIINDIDARTG